MNDAKTERKIEIENYIKENNVTAIRNLLDVGMAPMEEILFVTTYEGKEYEGNTSLINLISSAVKVSYITVW